MKVVIIGNGILGLTTAYKLLKKDSSATVTLIGPFNNKGCASLAAAAMFNSFAEVDNNTRGNDIEWQKFLFNKLSTPFWPGFLKQLEADSNKKMEYGFGTFVINNHSSDELEDENFKAIIDALTEFNEEFEYVNPAHIANYKPSAFGRAASAIYIKNEGWVNPVLLIDALKAILQKSGRAIFVDDYCQALHRVEDRVQYAETGAGFKVEGDAFVLTPGATFSKIVNASNLDLKFPKIFYGVGCSLLLKTGAITLNNCVRTPNRGGACGVYSAPQDHAHTLIGATNLISPEPIDYPNANNVYSLLKSAMEQINTDYFRCELVKTNIGWRPTSEDTLPLIGKTSIGNLVVATGTKRDGLHCSPVISDYLSSLLLGQPPVYDLALFAPEREPVKFYTREEAISIGVRHTINAAFQHDFVPSKNRMMEDLEKYYRQDLEALHDKVGAIEWGIPPEMTNMYRYGHIK